MSNFEECSKLITHEQQVNFLCLLKHTQRKPPMSKHRARDVGMGNTDKKVKHRNTFRAANPAYTHLQWVDQLS